MNEVIIKQDLSCYLTIENNKSCLITENHQVKEDIYNTPFSSFLKASKGSSTTSDNNVKHIIMLTIL